MLDDPFAHIGSVGFDALVRLLRGEAEWKPTRLPTRKDAVTASGALTLAFATMSPRWKEALPHVLRERLNRAGTLGAEEAVCAAMLYSDAIAEDETEQDRWMAAVTKAAGNAAPDAETPFMLHSTVYAQLARGWPKYSGNLTIVFSSANAPGSSGVDRFVCSADRKGSEEFSERNIDAGELTTVGYKTPSEVEAVMVSPPSAHPGVGRRLGKRQPVFSRQGDGSEASFRAAFPSFNMSFDQIDDFEEAWVEKKTDALQYPMPFDPPTLQSAFFRVRNTAHKRGTAESVGSMVAVLAPLLLPHKVNSIQARPANNGQPRFVVANATMGADACRECGRSTNVRRCYAQQTAASTTEVPVVGYLFRCSNSTFQTMESATLTPSCGRWSLCPSLRSALSRVRAHSKSDHARICRAWEHLRGAASEALLKDAAVPGWPSPEVMARMRRIRLRSPASTVNLHSRNTSSGQPLDVVCGLSLQTVAYSGNDAEFAAMCSSSEAAMPEEPPPPKAVQPDGCHGSKLSVCRCDALFRNRSSVLARMWGTAGWKLVSATEPPCWGAGDGQAFFDRLIAGDKAICDRNWYSAIPPKHLAKHVPTMEADAPSVLGFDDDIKDYCMAINHYSDVQRWRLNASAPTSRRRLGSASTECARANRTMLEMDDDEYNSCRNLEWQTCAARGRVPGQKTASIVFATAPGEVEMDGADGKPTLSSCIGHAPYDCGSVGFANDQIFYAEACAYSKICENRKELFKVKAGELFTCEVSEEGVRELQRLLVAAASGAA